MSRRPTTSSKRTRPTPSTQSRFWVSRSREWSSGASTYHFSDPHAAAYGEAEPVCGVGDADGSFRDKHSVLALSLITRNWQISIAICDLYFAKVNKNGRSGRQSPFFSRPSRSTSDHDYSNNHDHVEVSRRRPGSTNVRRAQDATQDPLGRELDLLEVVGAAARLSR